MVQEVYDALGNADKEADSAVFVELMLEIIRDTLQEVTVLGNQTDQDSDQETDQDNEFLQRCRKEGKNGISGNKQIYEPDFEA